MGNEILGSSLMQNQNPPHFRFRWTIRFLKVTVPIGFVLALFSASFGLLGEEGPEASGIFIITFSQPLVNIFKLEAFEFRFDSVIAVFGGVATPLQILLFSLVMILSNATVVGFLAGFLTDVSLYLKSEMFP